MQWDIHGQAKRLGAEGWILVDGGIREFEGEKASISRLESAALGRSASVDDIERTEKTGWR